jgi:hypothetical protein
MMKEITRKKNKEMWYVRTGKLASTGSCEYGTKLLNVLKGEEFLNKLSDYQPAYKNSTPWNVLDGKAGANK